MKPGYYYVLSVGDMHEFPYEPDARGFAADEAGKQGIPFQVVKAIATYTPKDVRIVTVDE